MREKKGAWADRPALEVDYDEDAKKEIAEEE
jgi:hypothetical protein